MAAWWREWARRKESSASEAPKTVLELLERGETLRLLHPALDVADGVLFYGVPVDDRLTIITSRLGQTMGRQIGELAVRQYRKPVR